MNKNRLQSLLLRFVLHIPDKTWLNLTYKITNQRKLLTRFWGVLREIQENQSNLLTFKKLTNQSTLNKAHVI